MKVAEVVRERDGYLCILCKKIASGEIHHVVSRGRRKAYPEVEDERNLCVVCHKCHIDAPGGGGAHNQKNRFIALQYLIEIYGSEWYEAREPWAQILRRGEC